MKIRPEIPKTFLDNKIYAPENNLDNGGSESKGGFGRNPKENTEEFDASLFNEPLSDTLELSIKDQKKAKGQTFPKTERQGKSIFNKLILACAGMMGKKEEIEAIQQSLDQYKNRLHKFEEVIGVNSNSFTYHNLHNYRVKTNPASDHKKQEEVK